MKCLENEGVQYIFGIVGTETLDFVHSLESSTIQFIVVRHEQAAAFMADVYGRLTGLAGVCTSTLGPGATNLLTGVANAQFDHSPVVAITGQAGLARMHKTSHQSIDIENMYKPITKWSVQIKEAKTIPEVIRKAFKLSEMEKPGAVLVELPENLAHLKIDSKALPRVPLFQSIPTTQSMNEAIQLLNQSKKPFIIAGNGVIRTEASNELQTLAEKLNIPVAHSFMAKGVLPTSHPLNMYTFGFDTTDWIVEELEKTDLIITIGFDFNERLPEKWNINKKPVLHIDSLSAEVDEYYPISVELIGNLKETLNVLRQSKSLQAKNHMNYQALQTRVKKALGIEPLNTPSKMEEKVNPQEVMRILQKVTSANTIVISDVGANKMTVAKTFQPKRPNRVIISNGFASMGISLPGTIAAKLACPEDPAICITGDGGFMMNLAEIETAKRLNLCLVIIVLTDSMLGLEWQGMHKKFSSDYGVYFTNPDFMKIAASFNIIGMKVNHPRELEQTLIAALKQKEIVLVEIPIDNKSL